MPKGPRGPRKKFKAVKPRAIAAHPAEYEDDDDIDLRDTPEYRRRQFFIRLGTGVLLFAFLGTSGITCIGVGMSESHDGPAHTQGEAAQQQDQIGAEIARYQALLSKEPDNLENKEILGIYLLQRANSKVGKEASADHQEAQKLFESVVARDSENYRVLELLGRAQMANNQSKEAAASYARVLELTARPVDPKAPDKDIQESRLQATRVQAFLGLAEVNYSDKRLEGALKHIEEALSLNPGLGNAYLLRARIQIDRKQPEQARRDYQYALDIAMSIPGSEEGQRLAQEAIVGLQALEPPKSASPTPQATPQTSPLPGTVELPGSGNSTVP